MRVAVREEVRRAALSAALKTTRSQGRGALVDRAVRGVGVVGVGVGLGVVGLGGVGAGGALISGCYEVHDASITDAARVDATLPHDDAALFVDASRDQGAPLACDELLDGLAITAHEGGFVAEFTSAEARVDPAVGACCHELELAARAGEPTVEPFTPLALACCDVVVFEQSLETYSQLGCTPWGPPCPPEMPA